MFLDETGDIPWPALLYVTGQINYGGRVTDDLDRRCLMSILHCYYRPEVLDQDFSLSASGVYTTPPDASTLDEYIEFIHSLPQTDQPEVSYRRAPPHKLAETWCSSGYFAFVYGVAFA